MHSNNLVWYISSSAEWTIIRYFSRLCTKCRFIDLHWEACRIYLLSFRVVFIKIWTMSRKGLRLFHCLCWFCSFNAVHLLLLYIIRRTCFKYQFTFFRLLKADVISNFWKHTISVNSSINILRYQFRNLKVFNQVIHFAATILIWKYAELHLGNPFEIGLIFPLSVSRTLRIHFRYTLPV